MAASCVGLDGDGLAVVCLGVAMADFGFEGTRIGVTEHPCVLIEAITLGTGGWGMVIVAACGQERNGQYRGEQKKGCFGHSMESGMRGKPAIMAVMWDLCITMIREV